MANAGESIGNAIKGVFNAGHGAGEVIRGNLNQGFDSAGEAISGRLDNKREDQTGEPNQNAAYDANKQAENENVAQTGIQEVRKGLEQLKGGSGKQ